MSPETRAAIEAHALRDFPREACGLVIIEDGADVYVPCRNIAMTPSEHFIIHPDDHIAAKLRGEVVLVVHSHPNVPARPSQADRVQCENGQVEWLILSVFKEAPDRRPRIVGDFQFGPSGYQAPLVGREFSFGVLDCYSLIRDWYRIEMGVELPDFERRDEFWTNKYGPQVDLYSQYGQAGFAPVTDGTLRKGDVVIWQVARSTIRNHAGVYIGDGLLLHHMYNRLSCREPYDYADGQRKAHLVVRREC